MPHNDGARLTDIVTRLELRRCGEIKPLQPSSGSSTLENVAVHKDLYHSISSGMELYSDLSFLK